MVFEESKGWEWNKHGKEDKTQSINNIDKEEVHMENEEVEVIKDEVHIEDDDPHHGGNNVESSSVDSETEEERNAQCQV